METLLSKINGRIALGVLVLVILFIGNPVTCIGTGHRGVVMTYGAVSDRVLGEGIYLIIPFVNSTKSIDVRVKKVEASSIAPSHDLQDIHTVIALSYHLNPAKVNKLYQEIGLDFEEIIIIPAILETMKDTTAKFTASDLIVKRDVVSNTIRTSLEFKLTKFFIIVDEVSIKNFEFTKTFSESIELKQKAEQDALRAENDLVRIKTEAEQQIQEAKGQAEAFRLKAQQLTPQMLEMERIKKWDGHYPTTIMGSGANALIGIK